MPHPLSTEITYDDFKGFLEHQGFSVGQAKLILDDMGWTGTSVLSPKKYASIITRMAKAIVSLEESKGQV